jgi:hypothetical protein
MNNKKDCHVFIYKREKKKKNAKSDGHRVVTNDIPQTENGYPMEDIVFALLQNLFY